MYFTHILVERIKFQAKKAGLSISKMLEDCELSKNTLVSMNTRGSWIQANSLAKIADRLDCSVDYLLCRTERSDSHEIHMGDVVVNPNDEQLAAIIEAYKQLDTVGKAELLVFADKLNQNRKQLKD